MTGSIRLFIPHPLHAGAALQAAPEQAHHLGAVMRRGVGDPVTLFNGKDGEWQGHIAALRKDRATIAVDGLLREQDDEPGLTLMFAPLKRDATDLVIEKATELGVTRIWPVFTERSNTQRLNAERWAVIAREAAEQCERLTLPVIEQPGRLFEALGQWNPAETLSCAIERAEAAYPQHRPGPAALLVGPEGGFAPAEVTALRRLPFVVPVGLGRLVLRAETAVIAGLTLLQAARVPA
jgi:16S rRNA (uracil1498-N3)-methyltransferase